MNENEFVEKVAQLVREVLPKKYVPKPKANLYYQITLDNKLDIIVNPKEPKRGQSAFQTDLCIFLQKNGVLLPKVVFEFKREITTHDVITYSSKARRHKQIYPYLRYGLISYDISRIPRKFFIHNEGLDFHIALKDHMSNLDRVLAGLIKEELEMSDVLESTIFGTNDFDFFRTRVEFKKLER